MATHTIKIEWGMSKSNLIKSLKSDGYAVEVE